jgi:hypothetical protein
MKNPEEAIEKVLAALRSSDAPPGMERRILEAAQNRASSQTLSAWHRLSPTWLVTQKRPLAVASLACGIVMAGILVVALKIPAIHRPARNPAKSKMSPALAVPSSIPPLETTAKSTQPRSPQPDVSFTRKTNVRKVKLIHDTDSLALRETRAPSHPAPEQPLTEQEKLLLKIIRGNAPQQLIALNHSLETSHDEDEKAAFQRFFEPAKTGENE